MTKRSRNNRRSKKPGSGGGKSGSAPKGRKHTRHRGHRGAGGRSGPRQAGLQKALEKTRKNLQHLLTPVIPEEHSTELSLDPWQQEALDELLQGNHVVVDAPTTAGKTRVVEAFFDHCIEGEGFRAAYTTPVKSLSNDKVLEFRERYGDEKVGIATGDVKENLQAPVVVTTLESYRNSLLGVEPDLGRQLVVFDEYHFLQDQARGSAWEEAIILSPPGCQLLLLSASVDNPASFCTWLEKITRKTCRLITTKTRPVPLKNLIFNSGYWLSDDSFDVPRKNPRDPLYRFPMEHEEIAMRLRRIPELGLTPCIVYAGQRLACEHLAREIARALPPCTDEEQDEIRQLIESAGDSDMKGRVLPGRLFGMMVRSGVGYHHSGLSPNARVLVERLVKEGRLRFCVATMGLSLGINFSVRSAMISDFRRPGESGFTDYSTSEILQMLGRAGRRGKDAAGFSLWPNPQAWHKQSGGQREAIRSRLRNDPTTFLGLVGRGFNLRDIENFYEKSFMRFLDRRVNLRLIRPERHAGQLGEKLPCVSPATSYARFLYDKSPGECQECPLQERCHPALERATEGTLAALHVHLHGIGCLNEKGQLTRSGSIARYFPQAGGLMIAGFLADGSITDDRLLEGAELMAAMTMARFKDPGVPSSYRFPFNGRQLQEKLEHFYYPYDLFEELYDPPFGRRSHPVLREFNPAAGYIIRRWGTGVPWTDLRAEVTHEKFGEGDLMAIIFRTATYLQSLAGAGLGDISASAIALRDAILRPPLTPATSTQDTTPET